MDTCQCRPCGYGDSLVCTNCGKPHVPPAPPPPSATSRRLVEEYSVALRAMPKGYADPLSKPMVDAADATLKSLLDHLAALERLARLGQSPPWHTVLLKDGRRIREEHRSFRDYCYLCEHRRLYKECFGDG